MKAALLPLVWAAVDVRIDYDVGKGWESYADVKLPLENVAPTPNTQVLTQIQDPHEESLCTSLWSSMEGSEKYIRFRIRDGQEEQVGMGYCDLTPVRNYKGFCRLLSNVEFVAELDANQTKVLNVLVKPPTANQEQMTRTRLGFVSVLLPEKTPPVSETVATAVLPDRPEKIIEQPAAGNWWWGFLIAMVAMQVLNLFTNKDAPPPAAAAPKRRA